MAQAIVNLTLPVITSKVEEALNSITTASHQNRFAVKELREELVTYVLRRMPTVYTTTETSQMWAFEAPIHCFSKEQQNQMNDLIHEGIDHLMQRHPPRNAAPQAAAQSSDSAPSNWFG